MIFHLDILFMLHVEFICFNLLGGRGYLIFIIFYCIFHFHIFIILDNDIPPRYFIHVACEIYLF